MAELVQVNKEIGVEPFKITVATSLNKPTRLQIEQGLVLKGLTLPLPRSMAFYAEGASGKLFFIVYGKDLDTYGFEKLTEAV